MAYTKKQKEEEFKKVLDLIESGKSLRQALKDNGKPSMTVFFEWLKEDEGEDLAHTETKQYAYAYACEIRADKIFEEMFEIADDGTNDYMTIEKGDNSYNVEDREVTSRSKLRIDTRKWALSKMMPKKYGDKSEITLEGGEKPIVISFKD
jgi:hypothetical protein